MPDNDFTWIITRDENLSSAHGVGGWMNDGWSERGEIFSSRAIKIIQRDNRRLSDAWEAKILKLNQLFWSFIVRHRGQGRMESRPNN